MLKTSERGLKLIQEFEGWVQKVYKDPVGLPTVGFGHLVLPEDNLKLGQLISRERAEAFLKKDVEIAEHAVLRNVIVPLNQNQFDALVSFTFNLGEGNLRKSTLLKKVNKRLWTEAANELMKWNRATSKGKLVVLPGLTRRRDAEKKLFLRLEDSEVTFK